MDYKELANLIFPDAKDISYYEEKYPERNLPEGAIVTRFAPSPTGYVHIGGLYQSLVAKMSAKKTGGVFFLRIEDTDQKRKVENGVTDIVNSLKVFDMAPDEGMISETEWTGDYGPYIQSEINRLCQRKPTRTGFFLFLLCGYLIFQSGLLRVALCICCK